MRKTILGLDICGESFSAVLVGTGIKGSRVIGFHHGGLGVENNDPGRELIKALPQIPDTLSSSDHDVAIALDARRVSFRNLRVPFQNPEKIRQVLPFELEPLLPEPVENLLVDFMPANLPDRNDLIAAAVDREFFDELVKGLSQSGLIASHVSISGLAAAAYLAKFASLPEHSLVLHLGVESATLFAVIWAEIVLIRSFNIPKKDSERYDRLALGIQQTVIAAESLLEQPFSPETIFLTGAPGGFSSVEQAMESRLELDMEAVDIAALAGNIRFLSQKNWEPSLMNNAMALVLLRIEGIGVLDFLGETARAAGFFGQYTSELIRTGALAAVVAVIFFINLFVTNHILENRLELIEAETRKVFSSTFPEVTRIVDPVQQTQVAINEIRKKQLPDGVDGPKVRALDILNEISKRISATTDIALTRLILGQDSVQLSGSAGTFNSVNDIQSFLTPVPFFKKVMITSASVDRTGNRVQFKIRADL